MGFHLAKSDVQKLMASGATLGPSVQLPREEKKAAHKPGNIYRMTIPNWKPPTLNVLMRGKIKTRIALGKATKAIVAGYALKEEVPKAGGRRRVNVFVVLEGRQREADTDAYWKGLLDALVSCGLLLGDKSAHVQLGEVMHERGKSGTVIVLEDL